MRRMVAPLLTLVLLTMAVPPAAAHPALPVSPTAPTDLTWAATDNVEYLGRFPEHSGTAGGRVLGDRFYVTDPRGVYVYDTTTPEEPVLLGALPLPQSSTGVALAQEDPDTDGHILLVDAINPADPTAGANLQVVDVEDPSEGLSVIGTAPVTDHTWTCVTTADGRCSYAYGRTGHIVDLTDPTAPVVLDTSWRTHVGLNGEGDAGFTNTPYTHDLTEVRTGRVMSAGKHNVLMDTTDPTAPRRLANITTDFHMFGYHSVEWANDGHDGLLVAGTEIAPDGTTNLAGSDCQGEGSWISTYDTSEILKADHPYTRSGGRADSYEGVEFVHRDDYHVQEAGLFLEGNAPAHTLYCAHWMELAPSFADGGRMVAGYYSWGTRFVDIAPDGSMAEAGWFVPAEGYTGSAQWVSDEVVYVMDYRRGLEVLRLSDEPATGVVTHGADMIAAGAAVKPLTLDGHGRSPSLLALAAGLLLGAAGLARRRAVVARTA